MKQRVKFTRKYAPKYIKDFVAQEEIKERMSNIVKRRTFTHVLALGAPGVGKTTMLKAYVNEMTGGKVSGDNFKEYNTSDDRGIDFVRDLKKLAMSRTLTKVFILLDEVDGMTAPALDAMRWLMEHTENVILLMTANKEKSGETWEAIRSRCTVLRFKPLDDDSCTKFVLDILKKEKVKIEWTDEAIAGMEGLVEDAVGDMRLLLNQFESLINEKNEITEKSILTMRKIRIGGIILQKAIEGDFSSAKKMLKTAHVNGTSSGIFNEWIDAISDLNIRLDDKILFYSRLADHYGIYLMARNKLIPMLGFVSFVWAALHVPMNPITLAKQSSGEVKLGIEE